MNYDDEGAARASDPSTSHEAAESLDVGRLQGVVLGTLAKARTGLTTHEIARECGIGYQTITPRMKGLCSKGLVFDTGLRRLWEGGPGSPATTRKSIVWQLTSLASPAKELEEEI
jgi:predicted transcriptional regulator